jgi:hypothetical protein
MHAVFRCRIRRACVAWSFFLFVGIGVSGLQAHEPMDSSAQVKITRSGLQLNLTLGLDVVRETLAGAGLSSEAIRQVMVSRGPRANHELPPSLAGRWFELSSNGEPLLARRVSSLSDGTEVVLQVDYPPPPAGRLEFQAVYFGAGAHVRPGWLVVSDEQETQLLAALLSVTGSVAGLTLSSPEATSPTTIMAGSAKDSISPAAEKAGRESPAPTWSATRKWLLVLGSFGSLGTILFCGWAIRHRREANRGSNEY